jgi:hypothetical protein
MLTAVAVLLAVGAYVAWQALYSGMSLRLPTTQSCVVSGDGPDLVSFNAEQMANAATISAVGIRRGVPQRAVVVALATALQESKLRNLTGGDRDSIGLFQQRPSQGWGQPEQIVDPRYAAGRFYTALLKVRGWQDMRVTEAAQAVQRSAHPEAYEKWVEQSSVLARAFAGDATGAVACTVSADPPQRGAAAAAALADGVRLDWGDVITSDNTEVTGIALPVADARAGWQYAHWLVAHAADRGVKRVRFGDREWTAKGGSWGRLGSAQPVAAERVVAEVYSQS